jgi:hypothetical protein
MVRLLAALFAEDDLTLECDRLLMPLVRDLRPFEEPVRSVGPDVRAMISPPQ